MIGQIIQSYLVSLGVQVDKPGFQQADQTIKQTGENVERITGGMARNFVKASTIIGSAIASVTASAVGLMKAAAQEDLAMQKYARSMMMSEDAAWKMKKATDALGESINDIALTPELLGRFTQLTADGSKMKVGGDFKQTMKDFRDLMFEFTRLKQEASYALNWVGYYLMKYLQKPLADIREKFKAFNDSVIKNMSVWTEKVARAIYYVIEVGRHLIEFLGDIGKAVYKLWDSFPSGVKKAIAAIGLLTAVLKASPFSRAIMLISTLLLLIDDYYGYMEGKNAALGKYWDKLNEYLEKGKTLWEQLKTKAEPYWNMLVEYAGRAKDWFDELVEGAGQLKKSFDEWMESTGNELLAEVVEECQSLWGILTDIGTVLQETVVDAWKGLIEQLEKNGTIDDTRKAFERVWRIVKMVYQAGKDLIKWFVRLWRELEKSEEVQEFGAAIIELVDAVMELFGAIMEVVETALRAFFGEFNKTNKVTAFRDVLRSVAKALAVMARGISSVIRWLSRLFSKVANNKTFISFWKKVADAIDIVVKKAGKLGRALGALLDGSPKKAWEILKSLGDPEIDVGSKFSKGGKESDDPRVHIAEEVAARTGARADLIYGQMIQEAGWELSPLAKEHHNYAGIKHYEGAIGYVADDRNHQGFASDEEFIEEYSRVLARDFGSALSAQTPEEWAKKLKEENYFRDDETKYAAGVRAGAEAYNSLPNKPVSEDDGDSDNAPGAGGDLHRKYFRKWSSVEGMDTPWESNDATNTDDFRQTTVDMLNALGKAYYEQFGEQLVITGGAEKGDYHAAGKYSHANGYKVDISDDINQYQRMWLEQWLETNEKRYGIRYNHEADKAHYDIVAGHPMAMQTAYTTEKANAVPLGTQMPAMAMPERTPHKYDDAPRPDQLDGYEDSRLKKLPTPQQPSIRQVAKEAGESVQRVKETVREKVVQPMIAVQEKAHISEVKTETTAYLKQITFLLADIRKAMPSIGSSILPTVAKTTPERGTTPVVSSKPKEKPPTDNLSQVMALLADIKKAILGIGGVTVIQPAPEKEREDSLAVPSKPQERPQIDSLSQVTALLADIKRAIQSLSTITVVQPPTDKGERYEIVYPEAKEKPKGENLAGILQQILAAAQGIKKALPEDVNLEKAMEPLQNAFPTEAVAELKQAAENLRREIPMEGLEQVGDKIAGEVAKAMPAGDFEAIEGFLKNAGFEGFGKHIQDLGKIGRAATEPLLQAQAPVYVSPTIDGGKQPANVNVKVDLGGITVNGVKDPQAAADVVFKNAEKEFSLAYGRLLSNNHGLQA